ncbi:MAG TPA: hypothetical protein DDW52_07695 [Planctomycetaceae bacterium]|nr:hypothetical protein [Planctomycetaceae bacterium]
MLKIFPLFAVALLIVGGVARADFVLLGYDTTNPNGENGAPSPDLPAADVAGFITPLLLSRGAGVNPNQGIAFNSNNWSLASSADLSSDKYIQWGWSASTQNVDLTNMTLQYDVSDKGPDQLVIAISVDGGSFSTIFTDTAVDPSDETHTIDLSAFTNVETATFRLFGFDADDPGGTLDIEEIVEDGARGIFVRGDLSAVPEPSCLGLLGFAALTGCLRRRRD